MFRSVLITFVLLCLAAQVWAAPAAPVLSYETNGLNLSITWTQVPDATGYKLYYAPYPFPGPESIGSIDVGNQTSMHVTLPEGAAYYIAVTAYDASGAEGPISNVEQFIITLAASDAPVLSVDTDGLYVSLSWTAVPGAAGYKLYYADDTAPESFQGFDAGGLTNISFYLWEGAAFYLKVTAYTSSGLESEFSNTEYFVMGPPTPEWVDDDGDGFIEFDGDCDDTNASISPAALEVCEDGIDQDCNGEDLSCGTDDNDDDNDGYTENQGDCNDGNSSIHPGATEICGDGIDQDCDGLDEVCSVDSNDVDDDQDGFTENQGDCNDAQAAVNPQAVEICGDGIDQDCNGVDKICPVDPNDVDNDQDGFTENQGDCNDALATVNPQAAEICGDGIDQDCNGADEVCPVDPNDVDDDQDGFTENHGDCNDTRSDIHPETWETCGDGIDQDCSGQDLACPTGESTFESELRLLINQYRSDNSLGSLAYHQGLQGLALEHNMYMIQTGVMSHAGFNEIRWPRAQTFGCVRLVENLGWNFQTPQAMFDGWKNSPGHNANMLDTEINMIGLSKSGAYITMLGCRIP